MKTKKNVTKFLIIIFVNLTTIHSALYYWDRATIEGFQAGNGTWSPDSISWASDTTGKILVAWPGTSGNTAIFSGITGNYTVTLKDTQLVDS
ncbi:MAG: hypothetical protein N2053_12140, partial [Chitinispirillaceae bacterium]|nr:hypothetical protein [Chitinispirillaceae bacterium]